MHHDVICSVCSTMIPGEYTFFREYTFMSLEIRQGVCQACKDVPPCPNHPGGIHTEIRTRDDEDWSDEWFREWFTEEEQKLPSYQIGICFSCNEPHFWSVEKQTWQTRPERQYRVFIRETERSGPSPGTVPLQQHSGS